MIYIIIVVILLTSELIYFRVADHYNIIDKPNERSSHSAITLRGGGVVYWFAALLYLLYYQNIFSIGFFIGITLIAAVSFMDDVKGISQLSRLIIHLIAMSIVFYVLQIFGNFPWWLVLFGYIFFIGTVNAYNFMDGINGITGLYSLAVLMSLQYVNLNVLAFVEADFIWFPILASVVFLVFNFRKKAKCFAGDVGSIAIAFWVITLLLLLMIQSKNLIWVGFLAVYGTDSVLTILHRLYLKQNIFDAHRLHFYQILANEKRKDHRVVSALYFMSQILVSSVIIRFYDSGRGWWFLFGILLVLAFVYLLKFKILNKIKHAHY